MLITVITKEFQSYPPPHRSISHPRNLLDNALKFGEKKRPEPRLDKSVSCMDITHSNAQRPGCLGKRYTN